MLDRPAEVGVELPWVCLTCGYSEVPGDDFVLHDCDTFRALPARERRANHDAWEAETRRRLADWQVVQP